MQVLSLFKGDFAFCLLMALKHAHRIQARGRRRDAETEQGSEKKKARFEAFVASHDAKNVQKRGAELILHAEAPTL